MATPTMSSPSPAAAATAAAGGSVTAVENADNCALQRTTAEFLARYLTTTATARVLILDICGDFDVQLMVSAISALISENGAKTSTNIYDRQSNAHHTNVNVNVNKTMIAPYLARVSYVRCPLLRAAAERILVVPQWGAVLVEATAAAATAAAEVAAVAVIQMNRWLFRALAAHELSAAQVNAQCVRFLIAAKQAAEESGARVVLVDTEKSALRDALVDYSCATLI